MIATPVRRRCRSLFLSDLHLGARACRAQALLTFLQGVECDRLYLLGDIIDGWRLSRRWFWPAGHGAVLEHLLALSRDGVPITYVPGNHDAFARGYDGVSLGPVVVAGEAAHLAADGRRYLLTHGDLYDPGARGSTVERRLGDLAYRGLMRLDGWAGRLGRGCGLAEASVAAWLKRRSGLAVRVARRYEHALAAEARRRGFDGVVCGHIHHAATRDIDGVAYVNCGDWVESCSAVVETTDGVLEVVRWRSAAPAVPRRRATMSDLPAWSA